ncbi:hypothetical protein [Novipirellula galeiformis]|uniref:hypothetical protein n=1 Tax=Novipirellula galeiformis TaxID=2528004 RepID=UPI0011B80AED|nr:hypothetical protein [Novipirellula galeiformis]
MSSEKELVEVSCASDGSSEMPLSAAEYQATKTNYLEGVPDLTQDISGLSDEEIVEIEAKMTLDAIQWNRRLRSIGVSIGHLDVPFRFQPDELLPRSCSLPQVGRDEMISQILERIATEARHDPMLSVPAEG